MNNTAKITYFYTNKGDGNIAYHVNDNEEDVSRNRVLLKKKYNITVENLRYMNQTHGSNIEVINDNSPLCIDDCDAIITNKVDIPLMVMVADCIPILMYDENKNVIAAIHAGRNSTFSKIAHKTVLKMINEFNCDVKDIKVNLGPSIQKCCYEVSPELVDIVKTSFGSEFVDNRLIDLQGINKKQLLSLGVKNENIEISKICTKCSNEDYFSYRINKDCGRFSGIIVIK